MNRALVILSGGQDSTTCLFWTKQRYDEVHAITFDYGQRHSRELEAARKVAAMAECASHEIITLGSVLKGSSPLVSDNSLEQYSGHGALPGGLEKTFVPGRNMLFFVLAGNRAYNLGITDIISGVCQEDYGGYPDCRLEFVYRMQEAMTLGLAYDANDPMANLKILTPLMHLTKRETVVWAMSIPGCMDALAFTHTSYDGQYPPVGHDHATLLREKGFEEAGVPDPLVVRAWSEGLMSLPETDNYADLRNTASIKEIPVGQAI